ncbi:alpha/beta fold hydrolase [Mesorhizobium sp.]|uniref:alpha/beta fold hydrolase n=1 Tax=Mesorhizobium sp. TaxID=1871066 RepID=UPI000FE507D5|nr:alpha/beta fold hydrolase [Mesorhizobium sp.]RWK55913.1 MAG: alpha/beta fold hydrolase [Mesorhizobium sp.]
MPVSTYTIPGMHIRDHLVPVPLDWSKPDGETIEIFVREVVDSARQNDDLPLLVFLQGGPGGKSPRPTVGTPPWLAEALKTHRIVLPDQRGTGRSTRIESITMARFADAEAAADYLLLFRADSIVEDLEHVRKCLFGGRRWQSLGQSYGGFLTLTYLSRYPDALSSCYVAGGLPSLAPSADRVYWRTYPRAAQKTARYYKRFPDDVGRVAELADFIDANDVRLPDGDRLTVKRLQTVGIDLGMVPGLENVHWLIDEAFSAPGRLSDHFLASVMTLTSYDGYPLFAGLQESIYCHGPGATRWAAERVSAEHPEFAPWARPLLFLGEMTFPWMFKEIRSLRPFRAGVEALAARESYPELYDRARLAANSVPVAAVIYHDDLYVDAGLSLDTAAEVGNLTYWVTNEFEHDGIRQSAKVFKRLVNLVKERGGPV